MLVGSANGVNAMQARDREAKFPYGQYPVPTVTGKSSLATGRSAPLSIGTLKHS